jgi:hypothetical protein
MRYRLRTLLTQFTIRDLLWLTAVIAMIVVWRCDVARQEAVYRDMLRIRVGDYSSEFGIILHVAERHPELLTELKAFDAAFNKHVSERASLNYRFGKLDNKARDLFRGDKENDPVAFSDEELAKKPF